MIDTIKLGFPLTPELKRRIETYSHKLQRLSPCGAVEWEKSIASDALPSHFNGLRITLQEPREMAKRGFHNARALAHFEFSLAKWLSPTGYNNKNTSLFSDIQGLRSWFHLLSQALDYRFRASLWQLYRVDLAQNYILENATPDEYLRALELRFSQNPAGDKVTRYPSSLFYGSSWISKKIYAKFQEFWDVERAKRRAQYSEKYIAGEGGQILSMRLTQEYTGEKIPLTPMELHEMTKMLRFEEGFKRKYLVQHGLTSVNSLYQLEARFLEETKKYMTVQRLSSEQSYSNAEYKVIDLCKRYGMAVAKNKFCKEQTDRSWYRVKRSLITKGVYIEAIYNEDFRLDIETADRQSDFILRVA